MIDPLSHRPLVALLSVLLFACGCAASPPSSRPGFLYISQRDARSALMSVCLDNLESREVFFSDQINLIDLPQVSPNDNRIVVGGIQKTDGYNGLYLIEGAQARSLLTSAVLGYTPRWSPDGSQILFNGMTTAEPTNPEILLTDLNGVVTNMTQNRSSDFMPNWSPDGQSFTFISTRDGNSEVYLGSLKGDTAINLTQHAGEDNGGKWSPDGRWISFASDRSGESALYIMDVKNGYTISAFDLSAITGILNDTWSPDSAKIAISYGNQEEAKIVVFTLEDQTVTPIADAALTRSSLAAWSPDGQQLLWMSNMTGRYQIYLSDADGGNRRQLTEDSGDAIYPAWMRC